MLKRRTYRDWLVWVILICGIVSWIGFIDMARNIGRPFPGYISFRRTVAQTGEVDANTPIWWSGLIQNRLDYGDLLLRVDDQPYYPGVGAYIEQVASAGLQSVTLDIIPNGTDTIQTVTVPLETYTLTHFLDVRLPDIIMNLVFWLLAVVVYTSWPEGPANRAFALAAVVVGLIRALYVHTVFMDDAFSIGVELLLQTAIPLMGVCVIHFAGQFPVKAKPRWHRLTLSALAFALVVSLAAVASRLPGLPTPPLPGHAWFANLTYFGTLTLYFAGLIALFGRLLHRLIRRRARITKREQRTLLVVLLGLLIASPMLLITAFTWVTIDGRQLSYFWRGLDMRYLLMAVPLAFAYVLVRYQALRSPSALFIVVMALAGSALIAAAGAWLWAIGHPDWPDDGLRPPFVLLFVAVFVSSLIWLAFTSWRGPMGRYFQHERRSYAAARKFGRRVMGETNLQQLARSMAQALVEEFELERAAIWIGTPDGNLTLAASYGRFSGELPPTLRLRLDQSNLSPIHLDRPENLPDWAQSIAGKDFELAVPLVADGYLTGLIGLGPHWDAQIFDDRMVEIAELVGQQATLFLVAAHNVNELRQVPGRMAEVQEQERVRLAQELHDTIQQFLGRLPFYLAVSRDAVTTRPEMTYEILDRVIGDVESAAVDVRRIRHNLAPSQLEHGLTTSLAALARHFQERTGIRTSLSATAEVDEVTDIKSRHAIYRVVQQALDNVENHAEANRVEIWLQVQANRVAFAVNDNGQGLSESQQQAANHNGGFGLESMRARLEACDGEFSLKSATGQGTEIAGWVPVINSNDPPKGD
jgi:signal transduction histidine kinase